MKLTKISARNLKGLSFDLDLSAGVILVGSNFAGKSSRTDAIRLLLLGYLPELGKLPRATFGLSSARTMEVRGLFDNGIDIFRRWTLKGDSIKSEDNLDGLPIDLAHFGVMLNAETYFALSETERVKYVFGILAPDAIDLDPGKMLGKLRSALKEQKPAAVEALILEIDNAILPGSRETPQGYLEQFILLTADRAKVLRSESVRMEKTVQGLAQLRLADAPSDNRLEEVDAAIGKLAREIDELREKKGRIGSAYGQMVKDRDRHKAIAAELARIDRSLAGKAELERQLAECAAEIEATPEMLTAEGYGLTRDRIAGLRMDISNASREIAAADAAIAKAGQELVDLAGKVACPFCGASGSGWKVLKRAELESLVESEGLKKAQIVKTRDSAKVALAEAEALLTRAGEVSRRRDGLGEEHARISRQLATLAPAQSRADALREEDDRLMPDDPQLTAQVEIIQTEINVKTEESRKLLATRDALASRAAELSRLAEAEVARDKALVDKGVADEALEALREIQAELVATAFRPLLETANELFGKILPTPIAYHDGEIGTWREGVWVGHRTFSGTEKALTYAAIQIALAARAPFRMMILDELGRLDDKNAQKVDLAIDLALESGTIEQFVGIDAGRAGLHRAVKDETPDGETWGAFQVVEIN